MQVVLRFFCNTIVSVVWVIYKIDCWYFIQIGYGMVYSLFIIILYYTIYLFI
jgi:hypothetical protein